MTRSTASSRSGNSCGVGTSYGIGVSRIFALARGARGVILAAVAPGVAHVLDLGFVQVREFVFLGLRVNVVDDLAQDVAALDLVLDLAEDFPDLVFDSVRSARLLLEAMQVRKELRVDEVAEVVAGQNLVVVKFAVQALGRGPAFPSIGASRGYGCISCRQARPRWPCPAPGHLGISGTATRTSARCNRVRWCNRLLSKGHRRYS